MKESKNKQPDFCQEDELDKIEKLLGKVNLMVGGDSLEKSLPRPSPPSKIDDKIAKQSSESFLPEKATLSKEVKSKADSSDTLSLLPHIQENLRFLISSSSGEKLSWEKLLDLSISPQKLAELATKDLAKLKEIQAVLVFPGQRIAEYDEPLTLDDTTFAGAHIDFYSEPGVCKSQRFGYLSIVDGLLSVVSPLIVDASKMHVYLGIFDQQKHEVTIDMIQPWFLDRLLEKKIKAEVDQDRLSLLCQRISGGIEEKGAHLLASGRKPVHGHDAKIEFIEFKSEKILTTETMDHREVSNLPTAKKDQLLACRTLQVSAIPGINVYGKLIPVKSAVDHVLRAGENVRMVEKNGREYFYASIDGVVKVRGGSISVDKLLVFPNGVNYETGNIKFDGDVCVVGSVLGGFKLLAEGNIEITDSVLDGAQIVSGGSIIVGKGIVGKNTKVTARESVKALFVNEAKVKADGNIVLVNFAYNAHLFALGRIFINKGMGRRGGSIVGGEAIALAGLDTWIAGSDAWIATQLMTGFDPEKCERLERVQESITKSNTFLAKILELFAIPKLKADLIEKKINSAQGEQRKILVYHAKLLGQIVISHKTLLGMRKQLQTEMLAIPQDTKIEIKTIAYPEVLLRIGPYALKIERETGPSTFRQGEKEIIVT